ncbi:MAG: FliA/WhiG family RNA polymerase sigma factor, partial [Phycisphaerales bacterium]|nr:FliA/WhiG family RNA polymerase sigma factor [Phycisphaerales bacterium]
METATKKATPEIVQGWWKSYKKTASEDTRNQLLVHYFPLVRYTAERLLAKLPRGVDVDDLISSGT